jgi:hypothetical protein
MTRLKVAIYNLYWATYGGGEQVSGAIAETLSKYCDVTLLGPEEPNIEATRARLGVDLAGCSMILRPVLPVLTLMYSSTAPIAVTR